MPCFESGASHLGWWNCYVHIELLQFNYLHICTAVGSVVGSQCREVSLVACTYL